VLIATLQKMISYTRCSMEQKLGVTLKTNDSRPNEKQNKKIEYG
jgi:hypothetical protein